MCRTRRKIFVSYRYADDNVRHLTNQSWYVRTTVRDYLNTLEANLGKSNVYKGEHDDEDLSYLSESTIEEKLKRKIYDSSVTIVLVSPGMRDIGKPDSEQWIPWEISYSLRCVTRGGRTSHRNALLAVVLPDKYGSYTYAEGRYNKIMPEILQANIASGYARRVNWDTFQCNRDAWIDAAIASAQNCVECNVRIGI